MMMKGYFSRVDRFGMNIKFGAVIKEVSTELIGR